MGHPRTEQAEVGEVSEKMGILGPKPHPFSSQITSSCDSCDIIFVYDEIILSITTGPKQGLIMNDSIDYLIQIQGQIDEHDLNTMSPLEIKNVCTDDFSTSFEVCTDQSGLVGLLRHLHARSFTFLSITIQLANYEGVKRDDLSF